MVTMIVLLRVTMIVLLIETRIYNILLIIRRDTSIIPLIKNDNNLCGCL